MDSSNRQFLPHRRQRPLSDTSYEYHVFHSSSSPKIQDRVSKMSKSSRLLAIAMGIVAGLSTVGTGAIMMPLQPSNAPQVAGIQTTESYSPTTPPTSLPKTPVCWNQVKVQEEVLVWQDSCRGLPPIEYRKCLDRTIPLTENEEIAYRNWYAQDKVLAVECQAQPEDIPANLPARNPF